MKTSNDPRHQARRLAISIIYSNEVSGETNEIQLTDDILQTSKENLEIENYDSKLLKAIINGVNTHRDEIKTIIVKHSVDWALDKIYKIDLSILLSAIWEIKYSENPVKVIIDEAVELAKEFGENESPKFINGILAGVVKEL